MMSSDFELSVDDNCISEHNRAQIMDQVKDQLLIATAREFLQKMSVKCFKICIHKPGNALDNSEQECITTCTEKYMDSWQIVSRAFHARLQREMEQRQFDIIRM